ncbi:hypothetical protein DFP74_1801 [Nocardiopsis sp. Huas11]|uniref:spore-associated protein n=1 Tax=Nocardiopsis sp. Huas11 TaxID=2183912 RepID=UPI000F109A1E|nr:spore-associated protein [Nocardiopsis sp. Huas11]RKS06177.1 hypothetical protein DFP74_1801 [Nocardiopsis sp. Huas11]
MPTTDHTHEEAAVSPRKSRKRVWASAAGAIVVATSALVLTSATAAQGADPAQVCNTGRGLPDGAGPFRTVGSVAVPGGGGTVHLLYDDTYNCAVTTNNGVGTVYMDVGLRLAGSGAGAWDHGNFGEYAGPVYVSARGICVDYTGAVGDQSASRTGTNCEE